MRHVLFLILVLLSLGISYGQNQQDQQLAQQYYSNGEFEKAAQIYEKLLDKNPGNTFYYSNLYRSLLNLKDYDAIEKVIKRQMKRDKTNQRYLVDLGYVYNQNGQADLGTESYEEAIKNIQADANAIRRLANAFTSIREEDYVIKTYERGHELLNSNSQFSVELANAYLNKGDQKKAIEQTLVSVDTKPNQLQRVKNMLQKSKDKKKLYDELETQLYSGIQKDPGNLVYTELLIWVFIQRKDFESALIHAKAIDKRKDEEGKRIYDLAQAARRESKYDDAIGAYEYILTKGKDRSFYMPAKTDLLNCRKEKLENTIDYTSEDVQSLKSDYINFLDEHGRNVSTALTIRELSQLEAFYIHDMDEAIRLLDQLVVMPTLSQRMKSECKLDLGDYYVLKGDVWEATLLYSQVDKSEKDSPLGEEARYRNAKLSYYKGEFEWAQAQLNILKASTSELIANDALNLSIFIMDNLGLDTTTAPMKMFSRAELLMFQNRETDAMKTLDSISNLYPGHSLADDIEFARAKISARRKQYLEAVNHLNTIINVYGEDLLGDDATYMLANLYELQLDDKEKAMELYKDIIINYKDSVLVVEARKRFRKLRGDSVTQEEYN